MSETTLERQAGRAGLEFAEVLAGKVTDAVDGFPVHDHEHGTADEQQVAILAIVAARLHEHAAGVTA